MADDVSIKFGADVKDATAAIQQLTSVFQSTFGQITQIVAKTELGVQALKDIFSGGSFFGGAVTEAKNLGLEMGRLSDMLGISTEEASVLRVGLESVGTSTAEYAGLLQRLTMHVRTNEDRMNELGVVTRGTNHEFLDGAALLKNTVAALQEFKSGTDRNLASTEMLGRGWAGVTSIIRANDEVMAHASKTAEELGLNIGAKQRDQAREYQKAMAGVGEVFTGMANAMGQRLMPELTRLATWFTGVGSNMVGLADRLSAAYVAMSKSLFSVQGAFRALISPMEAVSGAMAEAGKAFAHPGVPGG